MKKKTPPHPCGYWTLERCKAESLKYNVKDHIPHGCLGAIRDNHWEEECLSHIHVQVKHKLPPLEECKRIAQKYRTRTEFQKSEDSWLYAQARLKGFLDEICAHMDKLHNISERCIYLITFPDHCAYVGLTCNFNRRMGNHKRSADSPIHKHILATGLQPTATIIHDYTLASEARKLEPQYLQQYMNEGWTMLNTNMACGEMGCADSGYSKQEVLREIKAKKYKTLKAFREGSPGYYESAYRSDYWDEIRNMLKILCVSHHWTKEEILALAHECKTYREFCNKHKRAAEWAMRNGFIDEIQVFLPARKVRKQYTDEEIWNAVRQCKTRSEFYYRFRGEYYAAYYRGYEEYERFCADLTTIHKNKAVKRKEKFAANKRFKKSAK